MYNLSGTWQTSGHVEQFVFPFHMEREVYTAVLLVVTCGFHLVDHVLGHIDIAYRRETSMVVLKALGYLH